MLVFPVNRFENKLNQYMYMIDLLDRNERLFYKLLSENVQQLMPIVYTPTVGEACQKFGYTFRRPQVYRADCPFSCFFSFNFWNGVIVASVRHDFCYFIPSVLR